MKKEERKFEDILTNMGETLAMLFGVIAILIIALNAARQHDNKEASKEEMYVPQNEFDALVHEYEMNHPDATIKDEIDYLREVYHTDSENELQTFMIEVTKCDLQEVAQEEVVVQLTDERLKPIVSWNYNYTPEEVILLGDLMYAEEMQYTDDPDGELVLKAAGSAVLHRVAECQGYFPNTIYDVIHDGEGTRSQQYATATLNKLGNIDTPEKVYQWAEDLLKNGPIGPANLVFQDGQQHGEIWLQYGNQYFCTSTKIEDPEIFAIAKESEIEVCNAGLQDCSFPED